MLAAALLAATTAYQPLLPLALTALCLIGMLLAIESLAELLRFGRRSVARLRSAARCAAVPTRVQWFSRVALLLVLVGVLSGVPALPRLAALLPARAAAMTDPDDPAGTFAGDGRGAVILRAADSTILGIGGIGPSYPLQGSVRAFSANSGAIHAIKHDGTLWTWGYGFTGRPGDTSGGPHGWTQVPGLSNVVFVSTMSGIRNVAVRQDGTVWAWGINGPYEPLGVSPDADCGGTSDLDCTTAPAQVAGLSGITAVSVGGEDGLLALRNDGTVWMWGNDYYCGGRARPAPEQVPGLSGVVAIATGNLHRLALTAAGEVWAWGAGEEDALGLGDTGPCQHTFTPGRVPGLTGARAIAADTTHSLAINGDGVMYAWGINDLGQLGDGTTINRGTPVAVKGPGGVGVLQPVAIVASGNNSYAVTGGYFDGALWGWGYNDSNRLGGPTGDICLGSVPCSLVPIAVSNPGLVVPSVDRTVYV